MSAHSFMTLSLSCAALALAACSSLTGLDGGSSYSCKAPEGVTCDSVSGVYANANANNLRGQHRAPQRPVTSPIGAAEPAGPRRPIAVSNPPTPVALRSTPRVLRLWFKPWEDADHDLYDQGYVYVQVDAGQWQIDHIQRQIRSAYLPLKAPPRGAAASSDTPAAARSAAGVLRPHGVVPPVPRQAATDSDE